MNNEIEIEKPKRKASEKQIENLKKMREKKLEISKAKKILNLEKEKPIYKKEQQEQSQEQKQEQKQQQTIKQNNETDLHYRISNIERELTEIKIRKKIKDELKKKINDEKENKKKAVDKDEIVDQQKKIDYVYENIKTIDYSKLFY
jgi:hypothetical protein